MNQYFILAFVVMPIIVVAMGCAALRLHDWDIRRQQTDRPAE